MSVQNPESANAAADALTDTHVVTEEQITDLDETRRELERPADPVPDDDAPATATATDGGTPGYQMTDDRRVGSVPLSVEGHGTIRFGKPSGRASAELLAPVENMEEEGGSLLDLTDYVWPTLASWAIDDHYDADWWADEVALVDAIQTLRQVALGGNLR